MTIELFVLIFIGASLFGFMCMMSRAVPSDKFLESLEKEPGALVFHKKIDPGRISTTTTHIYSTFVKGFYIDTRSPEPLAIPEHCVIIPRNGIPLEIAKTTLKNMGSRLYHFVAFWKKKS